MDLIENKFHSILCDKLVGDGGEELGSIVLRTHDVGTDGLLGLEETK